MTSRRKPPPTPLQPASAARPLEAPRPARRPAYVAVLRAVSAALLIAPTAAACGGSPRPEARPPGGMVAVEPAPITAEPSASASAAPAPAPSSTPDAG